MPATVSVIAFGTAITNSIDPINFLIASVAKASTFICCLTV